MKKKLFIFILTLISVVCLALGLSACGSGENDITITVYIGSEAAYTVTTNNSADYKITLETPEDITIDSSSEVYFAGWYLDGKYSTVYDEDTRFTEDSCVYAKMLTVYVSDFTYTVSNAEATITGFTNTTSTEVVIPTHLNTFPVTAIGDGAFTDMTMIRTLYMLDGIETIGDNAFCNCNSMSKIIMPDSVTSIGSKAFYNCTLLESITMPENVTSIGESAFYNCELLESITIPESITSIGDYAFYNCASLTEINYNARKISDLSSDNQIFFNAGLNGNGITVNIGSKVKNIPAYLFYNASLGENLSKIANIIFAKNSVCESIGSYAFYNCSALKSVNLPESLTSIGNWAFYNCNLLKTVNLGSDLTSIGDYAFCQCYSFISITLPDSVTTIGIGAFNCCTSLISVTLGKSVTSIGDSAFSTCPKLIEVYNLSALEITAGSSNNGCIAQYAKYVFTETSDHANIIYDGDYIFYNYNGSYQLIGYTGSDTVLALPTITVNGETVSYSIYQYAFYKNTKITSVTIPNGVTAIGDGAFLQCTSLESITIPDSVTSIGEATFLYCGSLTSVTIGSSVTSIGAYAFWYCTSLTSVTIPNSVISIGDYTFFFCTSLTSIMIGSSVTSIGNSAFLYCYKLTAVYYTGTEEQWGAVTIDTTENGNTCLTDADIYFYSEEPPAKSGNYWHYVNGEIVIWTDII